MPIKAKVEQWEGAGITDEASGRVGSSVRVAPLLVPDNVRVEGDRLCWDSWDPGSPSARWVTPDAAMFNAFTRIAQAKNRASAIERFAKRYGVFGARDPGPPTPAEFAAPGSRPSASVAWWPDRLLRRYITGSIGAGGAGMVMDRGPLTEEPLAAWDEILEGVIALLNIGSDLALEKPRLGAVKDWAVVFRDFDPQKESLGNARRRLSALLNDCLDLGAVRIQIGPAHAWAAARPSRWETTVNVARGGRRGLFGALALQTMLAVAGIDLYCCTGCKLPYVRSRLERRPKPNQNNYCNDCREDGQPVRDAKARYRRKEPK